VAATLPHASLNTPASKFRSCKTVHGAALELLSLAEGFPLLFQSSGPNRWGALMLLRVPSHQRQVRSSKSPAGLLVDLATVHHALQAQRRRRLWRSHLCCSLLQHPIAPLPDTTPAPAMSAGAKRGVRVAPQLAARQEVAAALAQLGFEQSQAHMPLLDASLSSIVQVRPAHARCHADSPWSDIAIHQGSLLTPAVSAVPL